MWVRLMAQLVPYLFLGRKGGFGRGDEVADGGGDFKGGFLLRGVMGVTGQITTIVLSKKISATGGKIDE